MTAQKITIIATLGAVALSGAAALAQTADHPTLIEVDLNQTGIARYALRAPVDGGDTIQLSVPKEHADDVLASLVVRDGSGGGVISLSTATPSATPEALLGTPFEDGGPPTSLVAALRALAGETVRVTSGMSTISGTLIGVSEREVVSDRQTIMTPTALILDAEGAMSEVVLTPGSSISIEDDIAAPLGEAVSAGHERDARRTFNLTLAPGEPRDIDLSYVTPAPVWKNSWRLLLDEGVLQGWATVENASAADWSDIKLTLSTGSPVAYERDMLTPTRIPRTQPPELMAARPVVRPDTGFEAMAAVEQRAQIKAPGAMADALGSAPIAELAGAARPAAAVQGVGSARFVLPDPVTIKAGETANLPYIDADVSPEIRALYQPDQNREVLLAVQIAADLTLPPGLVSVRDATGFVGDAAFTGMSAGQTRYLTYAAAPNAEVVQNRTERATGVSITASRNSLVAETRFVTRTVYEASVPDEVAIFAVEHPKSGDRVTRTTPEANIEETGTHYRVAVPTENGTARVEIETERVLRRSRVADADGLRAIVAEISAGDIDIAPKDGRVVDAAVEAVRSIQRSEAQLATLQADYERLAADQERVRRNLTAVRGTLGETGSLELTQRYRDELVQLSDELAENRIETGNARDKIATANDTLDELVAGLIRDLEPVQP